MANGCAKRSCPCGAPVLVFVRDGTVPVSEVDVADTAAVRPGPGPGVDGADDPADAPRSD